MIALLERIGLRKPWQRYLAILALSFPLALGLREALSWVLPADLAASAKAYVRGKDKRPLSEPLARLLADPDHPDVPTQPHPLLGKQAIAFDLLDHTGSPRQIGLLLGNKPVVLVFYYGYHCPHCVAQLFALNEDVSLFRELGGEVVAVSADPPEKTASQMARHGGFHFAVLSDPDNRVAQTYGVYKPAAGEEPESLAHATFLIGADGAVAWVNLGSEPFLDNKTLLRRLARAAGLQTGD